MSRFAPYANLLIFRPFGLSDGARIAELMQLEKPADKAVEPPEAPGSAWMLSTRRIISSASLLDHAGWIIKAVLAGRAGAVRQLRAEGYWVSVFFHDTVMPDSAVCAEVDAKLEELGVTFDFELERD
jgi:hypothetical protein